MKLIYPFVAVGLALVALVPLTATADEQTPNHLALFVGGGFETKDELGDEWGFALGLEYEYRFHKKWGVGALIEWLGQETIRNVVVIAPLSFHPAGGWRLFAGPGVEFTDEKDKFAFRVGAGYTFHLNATWSLSPEVFVDLIETGEQTYIGGVALGYTF